MKEDIQEGEYDFPYHHVVDINPFSETRHLFWGFRYAGYLQKILKTLEKTSFNSLIDIGCGDGKVIKEIHQRFPNKKVMGVDYSEKSLRFACAFSPDIPFATETKETFDAFTLIEVLEHINPIQMSSFLASIDKNLNVGGFGVITSPSDNIPLNPKHYQHWNAKSVTQVLSPFFNIVSIEYISANTIGVQIIQRLLANRFFILNYRPWTKWLYQFYQNRFVEATQKTASQLYIVVRKK